MQETLRELNDYQLVELLYDWKFWARPNQLPPSGDWSVWLVLAGRGYGKTRIGAEWVRENVESGKAKRVALVGETAADARDVMVEGESGLLSVSHPSFMPVYMPSKRRLEWPNGAIGTTYSAEEPKQLRGPQHDLAWADETAKWRYTDAWDQLMFGLRLGANPRCCATTTPSPVKIIKDLVNEAKKGSNVVITKGTTYENLKNLAKAFADKIIKKYEGTRLGRQELNAELLEDVPGALWNRDMLDANRVDFAPIMKRVIVAIDPAVTSGEESDETGMAVCGLGIDDQGYLLEDASGTYTPKEWANKAVSLYRKYSADRIIGESNNGGDLIEAVLRNVDDSVPYRKVHASRGKVVRAEPVSALDEQGRIHHVGTFSKMEDQMCEFTPDFDKKKMGYSPDRMEARVWGFTELMLGSSLIKGLDLS